MVGGGRDILHMSRTCYNLGQSGVKQRAPTVAPHLVHVEERKAAVPEAGLEKAVHRVRPECAAQLVGRELMHALQQGKLQAGEEGLAADEVAVGPEELREAVGGEVVRVTKRGFLDALMQSGGTEAEAGVGLGQHGEVQAVEVADVGNDVGLDVVAETAEEVAELERPERREVQVSAALEQALEDRGRAGRVLAGVANQRLHGVFAREQRGIQRVAHAALQEQGGAVSRPRQAAEYQQALSRVEVEELAQAHVADELCEGHVLAAGR
ncbi:uncharacterized protein BcabD6B2_40430 [Babesia caballi]|uniref:Uncharacterized protein n=1 Tax=Babesia caballi TaxID=5871 RepID=A0AAV4LY10_BABCB|nr:hypothetical protein BcabD6B2_40430 [Babesia caballi]